MVELPFCPLTAQLTRPCSQDQTLLVAAASLVAVPFLAIWLDIGSWWFTKTEPIFAYAVIAVGGLMGLSLALQIGISLVEMWGARSAEGKVSSLTLVQSKEDPR